MTAEQYADRIAERLRPLAAQLRTINATISYDPSADAFNVCRFGAIVIELTHQCVLTADPDAIVREACHG